VQTPISRKRLPHDVPSWAPDGSIYFITINASPRGSDVLLAQATALWDSVQFISKQGRWWPRLFVVMPDHVHGLFCFTREVGIQKVVRDWKHYTAHDLGIPWQRDFFEHRLRRDESLDEKSHYIRMNPVRRGLCAAPEDWPFIWSLHPR
jgi:REP element-mobilizing transposase RayT